MKPNQTTSWVVILLAILPICFAACVKDECARAHTYSYYEPVFQTKTEVRENIRSNSSRELVNTGKLYMYGQYIFLNEIDRGIHVIDNSNPSSPRNVAFIDVPGNMDIAVKGNVLYADLFTDLVAIDITNPLSVSVKKIIENKFPHRYWGGGFIQGNANNMVIVDWVKKDTTIIESCNGSSWGGPLRNDVFFSNASSLSSGGGGSPIGRGGSMARFTVKDNRLYTVGMSDLDVFNITTPADPIHTNRINVGWNIETIYPFKDKLFIGSMTGMYIYNVNNPDAPAAAGQFQHVRTCDPVIADDDYAYVTLSSGTRCQGFTNQLDVLKLNNFTDPTLVKTYQMHNPKGLSKSGDHLFICDGSEGLKVYNASNVNNLQLIRTIGGIDTYDVIAWNNVALVVAKDGLYQYDYSDINNIRLLSKISVNK